LKTIPYKKFPKKVRSFIESYFFDLFSKNKSLKNQLKLLHISSESLPENYPKFVKAEFSPPYKIKHFGKSINWGGIIHDTTHFFQYHVDKESFEKGRELLKVSTFSNYEIYYENKFEKEAFKAQEEFNKYESLKFSTLYPNAWISPSGEIREVDDHVIFSIENFPPYHHEEGVNEKMVEDIMEEMYRKGWIRISGVFENFIGISLYKLDYIKKGRIEDYLIKYRVDKNVEIIIDDQYSSSSRGFNGKVEEFFNFNKLSWKIMSDAYYELEKTLHDKNYSFHRVNDNIVIDHKGPLYLFNLTQLPENTVFNNKGPLYLFNLTQLPENTVFNNKGNVDLYSLTQLPSNTVFNNEGYVDLLSLTQLPSNKEQIFRNNGIVYYNVHKKYDPRTKKLSWKEINYPEESNDISILDNSIWVISDVRYGENVSKYFYIYKGYSNRDIEGRWDYDLKKLKIQVLYDIYNSSGNFPRYYLTDNDVNNIRFIQHWDPTMIKLGQSNKTYRIYNSKTGLFIKELTLEELSKQYKIYPSEAKRALNTNTAIKGFFIIDPTKEEKKRLRIPNRAERESEIRGKKIIGINPETGTEYSFNSARDAARELGIDRVSIIHALKGRQGSAGGWKWKYAGEETNKINKEEWVGKEFILNGSIYLQVIDIKEEKEPIIVLQDKNTKKVFNYTLPSLQENISNNKLIKISSKLSWKIMSDAYYELEKTLHNKNYSFHRVNDNIIIDHKGPLYLYNLTQLPENTVFNNEGFVALDNITQLPENTVFNNKGYVSLFSLDQLPENTIFNNIGYVFLPFLTQLPENKEQIFKNDGVVYYHGNDRAYDSRTKKLSWQSGKDSYKDISFNYDKDRGQQINEYEVGEEGSSALSPLVMKQPWNTENLVTDIDQDELKEKSLNWQDRSNTQLWI